MGEGKEKKNLNKTFKKKKEIWTLFGLKEQADTGLLKRRVEYVLRAVQ